MNITYINIICLQIICASFTSDVRQPHAACKPPWYTLCGIVNRVLRRIVGPRRSRLRLKCDGTRAENRFRLSVKRTSPFKSAGASVQSTTGSRVVRISGSNAGYTMFRDSVKSTGYPLHSPVSPSLPLPCVAVCHHISTGLLHARLQQSTNDVIPKLQIKNSLNILKVITWGGGGG
jgi:hypothetical protein